MVEALLYHRKKHENVLKSQLRKDMGNVMGKIRELENKIYYNWHAGDPTPVCSFNEV